MVQSGDCAVCKVRPLRAALCRGRISPSARGPPAMVSAPVPSSAAAPARPHCPPLIPPLCAVLSRVAAFLPQLQQANERLAEVSAALPIPLSLLSLSDRLLCPLPPPNVSALRLLLSLPCLVPQAMSGAGARSFRIDDDLREAGEEGDGEEDEVEEDQEEEEDEEKEDEDEEREAAHDSDGRTVKRRRHERHIEMVPSRRTQRRPRPSWRRLRVALSAEPPPPRAPLCCALLPLSCTRSWQSVC